LCLLIFFVTQAVRNEKPDAVELITPIAVGYSRTTVGILESTYREFLRLLEDYASVGLAELRSLNSITRGKAALDIESDD
jgi:hypothetical protein